MSKEFAFDFVSPISTLGFGCGICIRLLAWSNILRKSRRLSTKEVCSLFEIFSPWRIKRCRVFKSHSWNKLIANFFHEASAYSHYSMLGLGNVKQLWWKQLTTSVSSKNCCCNFRKMKKVCTNWEYAFSQTWNSFSQLILKNEIIGGVAVKTMQISSANHSNSFSQSDSNISFCVTRYEAVV